MGFPKYVKPYTATFTNVGQENEYLRLFSTYPLGVSWEHNFLVGTDCFLENPVDVSQVPDDQLIASLSMAAILAGKSLPGTIEYLNAVTQQDTKNFQTIVGEVRLKPQTTSFKNPEAVSDLTIGPEGTVFDITFQKGTGTNIKLLRLDAWTLSQYSNRIDNLDIACHVVPGALHKQFGYKKSDLGEADSLERLAICNWINNQRFWV